MGKVGKRMNVQWDPRGTDPRLSAMGQEVSETDRQKPPSGKARSNARQGQARPIGSDRKRRVAIKNA